MIRGLYLLALASLISVAAAAQDAETINPPELTAADNEAVVYFYRSNMIGGAIKFWAFVDEIPVGMLRGRQYAGAVVPAGEHILWARSGNISATTVTLDPGETYYFRIGTRMGAIKARANLEQKDASEALAEIAGLPFRRLTDEGRAEALEIVASEYAEAVEETR